MKRNTQNYGNVNPILYWVVSVISYTLAFTGLFVIDSLFINTSLSSKVKLIISIIVSLVMSLEAFGIFVFYDDSLYNWNPLGKNSLFGEYSNINFKNWCLSSLFNLILFIYKPFLGLLLKKIKIIVCKCKCCNEISTHSYRIHKNGPNVIRSTSVYKKPYFEWHNTNLTENELALAQSSPQ